MKTKSFDTSDLVSIFIICAVAFMVLGAPAIGVIKVIATQQALNQECKTNYNFLQVALAGDNLARLCQVKNQTITVK